MPYYVIETFTEYPEKAVTLRVAAFSGLRVGQIPDTLF